MNEEFKTGEHVLVNSNYPQKRGGKMSHGDSDFQRGDHLVVHKHDTKSGMVHVKTKSGERIGIPLKAEHLSLKEEVDLDEGWKKENPKSQEKINRDRAGHKVNTPDGPGEVTREHKVPTFSRSVPYSHQVAVKHADGTSKMHPIKSVKFVKENKMNEQVKDLIDAIDSGKSEAIESSFNAIMSEKMVAALDAKRSQVADQLFAKAEE